LIKGQVVNAQSAETIYVIKNENQKLKDRLVELEGDKEKALEMGRQQLHEQSINSNEIGQLHAKIEALNEENRQLRETPDHQRLEEELVLVKMREAEAQLAIKELQKTIHVLNLEYQEFLNNRSAAINSLSGPTIVKEQNQELQVIEEELLKVKMREAETYSEMKSINLKIMQLDTEKQVAYNQIKRKDEEFRNLTAEILQMKETGLDTSKILMDYRRQLDDKEALIKEQNMTHKLQEMEDAHIIAELKQRVASLEVQIQELVTTGQLNDNERNVFNVYNGIGESTDRLGEINDEMKYLLMASNTSLQSDSFQSNQKWNVPNSESYINSKPVSILLDSSAKMNSDGSNASVSDLSASLSSLPKQAIKQGLNRSRSEEATQTDRGESGDMQKKIDQTSDRNSPINENNFMSSDNDDGESDKSLLFKLNLERGNVETTTIAE